MQSRGSNTAIKKTRFRSTSPKIATQSTSESTKRRRVRGYKQIVSKTNKPLSLPYTQKDQINTSINTHHKGQTTISSNINTKLHFFRSLSSKLTRLNIRLRDNRRCKKSLRKAPRELEPKMILLMLMIRISKAAD